MSIRILKERERIIHIDFTLEFDYKLIPGSGFSFPCDSNGKIAADSMPDAAIENYNRCLLTIEQFYPPYVKKHKHSYVEPAIGECVCGEHIALEDDYMGACKCPVCGRWYNIFGQQLKDPKYWEDDECNEYPW